MASAGGHGGQEKPRVLAEAGRVFWRWLCLVFREALEPLIANVDAKPNLATNGVVWHTSEFHPVVDGSR
jgi:hypothetical protein